jgi:hypothetical protein
MWLVLCGANDLPALWAARGLESRGLQPLEIITPEVLAYNRRFVHRVATSQRSISIMLADGRVIDSAAICGTLNRLQLVPSEHLHGANATDRQYAEQELHALFLSWLNVLPGPVLNRPTPQGLSGAWRHLSEWIWMAAQAGLSTMSYRQSDGHSELLSNATSRGPTRSIIVIKDNCSGPTAPPTVTAGSVRLAELTKTTLLGVEFQITPAGDWIFRNATSLPDLRLGGEALLDVLANALRA